MAGALTRVSSRIYSTSQAAGPASARLFASHPEPQLFDLDTDARSERFGRKVYVAEGGPRVSTPEMPSPIRHSLMDATYGYGSLREPHYAYHPERQSPKPFGGWDPRSFGNSLGSSLRDPPYDVTRKH